MITSAHPRAPRAYLAIALGLVTFACGCGGSEQVSSPPAQTGVASVAVTPTSIALAQGDTLTLAASARDAGGSVVAGKSVVWTTSAAAVATISATGLVKAVSPGGATITATVDGKSATATLTVAARVVDEVSRAVTATIGAAGGTMTATSTSGVTYTFVVPALALDSSVSITMTPIARIGALPFSGGLLGGVEFQPTGLKFGPKTQLIIKPSASVPPLGPNQRLVGFTFERSVDTSSVQPASIRNGGFAITIEHFSSGGLAVGNVSDLATLPIVPNGSIQQQRVSQLAVLTMPQDRAAAVAIFQSWRNQIEALIATAQTGADAKVAVDLFVNWTWTLDGLSTATVGPVDSLLLAAVAPDRAALVAATQAAMKRGIDQLNQQCIKFQNLLDAENVLYLRNYAEGFTFNELTPNGSGLTLTAQLITLCVQPVQSFASFPNTFAANASAPLDLTYGVKFGTNTAAQGAFFDVTLTVSGAANNGASVVQTDGTGRTLPIQIATATTLITVKVQSCLAKGQLGLASPLPLLSVVCHFSTFTGNPPEVLSVVNVIQTSSPRALVVDALESNTGTFLVRENQATLPSQLVVDIVNPGNYSTSLSPGFIPVGTPVISYLLHADPVGQPANDVILIGSVTFLRDILGVISTAGSLNATDILLGAAGTIYPTGDIQRDAGVGPGSTDGDQITLSADRRTLSFAMQLKHYGQIRVVLKQ
ncbi:MAG: Ig-like domain-containing protein [bacterium]